MMGDLLMTMCEEILDIKTTTQPAMICSDSVYSTPAIDLKNSKVSCKGRALFLLNTALPIQGYIKDEVRLKRRTADSGSMFSLGERGNEYQIQDVTHYWREWHSPVFIGSSSAWVRQSMCFLFSIQEIGWAALGPELPIKAMPCLHCSFLGMTALLTHPWLSQLALNHRHTPSTGPTIW